MKKEETYFEVINDSYETLGRFTTRKEDNELLKSIKQYNKEIGFKERLTIEKTIYKVVDTKWNYVIY